MLVVHLLVGGLLDECKLCHGETSRGTSDEGMHHAAHGTCTLVGLEAASGASVLVDGHVGDLHLEHGDVVLEADCLGVAAVGIHVKPLVEGSLASAASHVVGTLEAALLHSSVALAVSLACLCGGLAVCAWWGALGRWERGQDTSPGQTSIGSLCWLGLGAGHKVVTHVWAVCGDLVALAIRSLTLGAVDLALFDCEVGLGGSLGGLLVSLTLLLGSLLGGLLGLGSTVSLLLLLVGLLGILLVGLVSLLGGLGEPLGSGGTRLLEGGSIGSSLLGVGGISLLLGMLLSSMTLVDAGGLGGSLLVCGLHGGSDGSLGSG